jgi:hypothetical protein
MTRAIPFTQASLKRAIEAARKAGLRIKGIAPDGTLLLEERDSQDEDRRDAKPQDHVL